MLRNLILGIFFKSPIFLFLLRMMKLIIVLKAMIKIRESSMTPWQGFCYNTFSIGSDSNCNIINNNLNMISFYRTGENKI